jgi:geranylgeranyl pyrophosphate synthase
MHRQKTGALIQASVLLGAISAGTADAAQRAALELFGAEIGLAFQIQDDILDGTSASPAWRNSRASWFPAPAEPVPSPFPPRV